MGFLKEVSHSTGGIPSPPLALWKMKERKLVEWLHSICFTKTGGLDEIDVTGYVTGYNMAVFLPQVMSQFTCEGTSDNTESGDRLQSNCPIK
jgi:hypothetical protein